MNLKIYRGEFAKTIIILKTKLENSNTTKRNWLAFQTKFVGNISKF